MIVRRLFAEMLALLLLLERWGAVTGSRLRHRKSVVVWLGSGDAMAARARPRRETPMADEINLGVGAGGTSCALEKRCAAHAVPFVRTSRTGRGLRSKLRIYSIYVLSLLYYKLQSVAGSAELVRAHRRATQRLTGAPRMAVNMDVLSAADALGLGVALPRVVDVSFCTVVRAANSERAALTEAARWLEEAALSGDCLLMPQQREFLQHLIVRRWSSALEKVAALFADVAVDCERLLQRALMRWCSEEHAHAWQYALDVTLRRRVQRWSVPCEERLIGVVRSAMTASVPEELESRF